MMPSNIDQFLYSLNDFTDAHSKLMYLAGNTEVLDYLVKLYNTDAFEYEQCLDKIYNVFAGGGKKGRAKQIIENYIGSKTKQESKTKLQEFSSVNWEDLAASKGVIFPTQDNFYKILLAANRVKSIWDNMSANVYYTMIDWTTTEPIFQLPGIETIYHKHNEFHNTELKRKLNQNGFPDESRWIALKEVIQNIAKQNKVDFYQAWMSQYRGIWDGVDRINDINNCFAIKYLGAAKERWSCSWARVLMLSLVWRCFSPGCSQRYYFTIEGEQNIGKTQFCRMLVPDIWYSSAALSVREDIVEFYRQTYDKAVIEFAELGGTDRASVNLFKRVVTETHSTFRRMRADDVIDYVKRNIIILTTNETAYLRDTTGSTRAITLRSELGQNEFMLLAELRAVYPQILAQAIQMYDEGISCYLNEDEFMLQKDQIDERDITATSDEYDIVCEYFRDDNRLAVAKEQGVYLDLVYTHAMAEWEMSKPELMRRSRAFGAALVRYGFKIHSNKAEHIPGVGTKKVWRWKSNR